MEKLTEQRQEKLNRLRVAEREKEADAGGAWRRARADDRSFFLDPLGGVVGAGGGRGGGVEWSFMAGHT